MKYRKKPIVIEAEQWHPEQEEGREFIGGWSNGVYMTSDSKTGYAIDTLEGSHEVTPGDWIITGVKGEKYPCKPDIFEMTYEPVINQIREGIK